MSHDPHTMNARTYATGCMILVGAFLSMLALSYLAVRWIVLPVFIRRLF